MNHPLKEVIKQTNINSSEYVELMKLFYNDIFDKKFEHIDEIINLQLYYIKLYKSSNNYHRIKLFNYFTDEEIKLNENYLKLSNKLKNEVYRSVMDNYKSFLYQPYKYKNYFCILIINDIYYLLLESNVKENGFKKFYPDKKIEIPN
jgi:hypothetical protein